MFALDTLTEREQQIVQLKCKGLSDKEVGRLSSLSTGTIKIYLHKIYEKLIIGLCSQQLR
jgi:DNA-binding NarL/FixJ family response regulator